MLYRFITCPILTLSQPVVPRYMARLLDLLRPAHLRMVAVSQRHPTQHVLVPTQRHRLDEDQTFPSQVCELDLHWHCHPGAAILGGRDICQLHLLPQRQQSLRTHPAL
jgi:hypothetical protein